MAAMDDDTGPSACRRGRGDDPCPPNAPARKKQKTPEVQAQALLQLGRLEGLASASVEPPRERPHATVAREFNVGVSTVRRWERQVEDGDGTGRRLTKHTHQFLARREAGEDVLRSEMLKDRVATQRELARATGASKSTVGRQQERLQVKHLSVFARPWRIAGTLGTAAPRACSSARATGLQNYEYKSPLKAGHCVAECNVLLSLARP